MSRDRSYKPYIIFVFLILLSVGIFFNLKTKYFPPVEQVKPLLGVMHYAGLQIPNSLNSSSNEKNQYKKYILANFSGSQICEPPVDDMTKQHVIKTPIFSCEKPPPSPMSQAEKRATRRRQIHITCNQDNSLATGEELEVSFDQPLQRFTTEASKACLHQYIREHCHDHRPVPDVIHLIWYGEALVSFKHSIGLYSLFTVAKPCLVILHGNVVPSGTMWDAILPAATNFVLVDKQPTTQTVRGKKIVALQNQADIGRIEVLIEYGGIYLDCDMVILHKLDIFRHVQFAANKEGSDRPGHLTNAVMLAVPDQELLKIWLGKWSSYDGIAWNSHSTLMLTALSKHFPHLMSFLGPIFIKFGFQDTELIYFNTCSLGESFAIQLYRRNFPETSDVTSVKTLNSTFGRVARYILFGDPQPCS